MGITLKSISLNASSQINNNSGNRGMFLEDVINKTNLYNIEHDICVVYKKPIPIKILHVNHSQVTGFFESKSTTDYCGCLQGRYIDFESKQTKSSSSFNLNNIPIHQLEHCQRVINSDGISFFIIYFSYYDEFYLLDTCYIINATNLNNKSLKYTFIKENGHLLSYDFLNGLNYVQIVLAKWFTK